VTQQLTREEYESLVLLQAQIFCRRYDAKGIGMTHSTSPPLHTNNGIAALENSKLHRIGDAPLEALVNVFLPWHLAEVRLLLVEGEGIDTTVQMGVPGRALVSGNHDNGADWAVLGNQTGGLATIKLLASSLTP